MNVDYDSDEKEREKAFSLFEHEGCGSERPKIYLDTIGYTHMLMTFFRIHQV